MSGNQFVAASADDGGFGRLLKQWRNRRGLSQLDLALAAHTTQRHVSFIESGRATPSRDMVLRICGTMSIPLRQQNALLLAAGYAPIWGERDLSAPDLAMVDTALGYMCSRLAGNTPAKPTRSMAFLQCASACESRRKQRCGNSLSGKMAGRAQPAYRLLALLPVSVGTTGQPTASALGQLLAFFRPVPSFRGPATSSGWMWRCGRATGKASGRQVRRPPPVWPELAGCTVGILGCGRIASRAPFETLTRRRSSAIGRPMKRFRVAQPPRGPILHARRWVETHRAKY
jgi:transcriptional regulator with XRE-family HTH domain